MIRAALALWIALAVYGNSQSIDWPFDDLSPIRWTKGISGTPNNFGEQNELLLTNENAGANVLALQNTAGVNPLSTLTFRSEYSREKMALGYLGTPSTNPLAPFAFLEVSDIDNPSVGTSTAPAFYLFITSSYGGTEPFGQHRRLSIATDGELMLHDRTGAPALTLTASSRTLALTPNIITSTAPIYQTIHRSEGGKNTYNLIANEVWNPAMNEGGSSHVGGYFSISTAGPNHITTPDPGGIIPLISTAILGGSGNVAMATSVVGWVRNLGTGALSDGIAYYASSPTASGPVERACAFFAAPQRTDGVQSGYAFVSRGENDHSDIAGTMRIGKTLASDGGIILRSKNGSRWLVTISDEGVLEAKPSP